MATGNDWEFSSLRWLHQVREKHYRKTKSKPLETWLQPVDAKNVAEACRRLGLKITIVPARKRRMRELA
jgi:hypothetical protein